MLDNAFEARVTVTATGRAVDIFIPEGDVDQNRASVRRRLERATGFMAAINRGFLQATDLEQQEAGTQVVRSITLSGLSKVTLNSISNTSSTNAYMTPFC